MSLPAIKLTKLEYRRLVNLVSIHGLDSDGTPTGSYELMRKLIEFENKLSNDSSGIVLTESFVKSNDTAQ